MRVAGWVADKLTYVAAYLAVALLVVWGAGRVTNYAVDTGFYRNFLMPWEIGLMEMRFKTVRWPQFKKNHPVAYMQSVAQLMKDHGVQPPRSNTQRQFIYRLTKFGNGATQILLVFHDNMLMIYGLPRVTFNRLDRFIDGDINAAQGDFTGQLSKDQITMIGSWKI